MSTHLPSSLEQFSEHTAGFVRENLEQQTMKDLTRLPQIAEQVENLYSVDHTRMLKAVAIVRAQGIKRLASGNYQVPSETDANHLYQVNIEHPRCNCLDAAKHASDPDHVCKHLAASFIWNTLPDAKVVSPELEEIKAFLFAPLSVKVIA